MTTKVIAFLAVTIGSYGYNFAPRTDSIFSSNGNKLRPDYFGFSVGLVSKDDGTTWLIAGAPRGNVSMYEHIIEPGMLYKCPVKVNSPSKECHHVFLDDSDYQKAHYMGVKKYYGYAWTGATIDVIRNNDVAVCAPNWNRLSRGDYYVLGKCYILSKQLEDSRNVEISPVQQYVDNYRVKGHYYYRAQIGMSLHFAKDTGSLLLGGPGMDLWCGRVVEMHETFASSYEGNTRVNISEYLTFSVPNIRQCRGDYGLFGYCVASGRFSGQKTYFVGGAPKADNLLGKVIVYHPRAFRSGRHDIKDQINGFQRGEFFGGSVTALDYDNNGLDDLVVGAPTHSMNGFREVGCVYLFLNIQGVILVYNVE